MNQEIERQRLKTQGLEKYVIQTEAPSGTIQWSMWSQAPDADHGLGHGVHYHDTARDPSQDLVAFIPGFAWLRSPPGTIVSGYYLQPDAITTPEVMAEIKKTIETLVAARERHFYPKTQITDRIYARGNC